MTDAPNYRIRPMNQSAKAARQGNPSYPEPILGNSAATLMESGVGNCFPGLEFDLRQLDVRFFPGLVFAFPGITPAGPDGTQGAQLVIADTEADPIFNEKHQWLADLKTQLNGPEGAALGSGQWYLHWVEQYGKRIELYDFTVWQNGVFRVPYEGETAWWIIRLIELDPDQSVADLTIALTQRDEDGQPMGNPVVLKGKRRAYLDDEGMIPDVYRPGELTSSMCSPWTHDFRDCACQYWASNHPDVALGEVDDPNHAISDGTSDDDPAQALNFLDWMRRRKSPSRDISAQPTIELARPSRYDPYEINLHWEELDFVLHGQETKSTPEPRFGHRQVNEPYEDLDQMIDDLANTLARLELTLAFEYLYAYFSLRAPDEVTEEQARNWPGLANDLRAARQLILGVAISEMTHLRWVNQTLWILCDAFADHTGPYKPVVSVIGDVPAPDPDNPDEEITRPPALRPATQDVIQEFVEVERPGGAVDTEYAALVAHLRERPDFYPVGLNELAVRIDTDGLSHFQKFRDTKRMLTPYAQNPDLYLRPVKEAAADDPLVKPALECLDRIIDALREGYLAEAASLNDLDAAETARDDIIQARDDMHALHDMAEALARDHGLGVPFFANADKYKTPLWKDRHG